MTDPKLLSRLVERYYTNQATAEELEVFIHLQKTGALDEALNHYWEEMIRAEILHPDEVFQPVVRKVWHWHIAAGVSVVLVSFLAAWFLMNAYEIHDVLVKTDAFDERQIVLPDGSLVTLNRNSTVSYPEKWSDGVRNVKLLLGEAYFEIKKNKDYPSFIVHTQDDLNINVLGTEFNVSSRHGDTYVYLHNGRVKIKKDDKEAFLDPGQLAQYSKRVGELRVMPASGERWLAWKNDMFYFDDATLSEISLALQEYYHKQVIIENESLKDLRFTGKISRNSIGMVLKILSRTLNIKIAQHKDQIIIENSEKVERHAD
ncbi:FecR family protein [Dyadobacter frigoris]|uniref:DUF4974 domain-containing protein n=1 Tax=Dyadobacter frigoris TaxID=2576211 RepID=A0A4U6CTM8_9BACT|nr:FecR domain-containing protein [Dyadobacter frigoris]TKT87035.1 DUF4974 domain-containing protein [Dyadobacter frigoris]GLU52766.1 anti-sigma factor [Dyadobacter frigoris]